MGQIRGDLSHLSAWLHKGGTKTYTGGVDDIVEGELGDQGVELEEEG